MRRIFHYPRIFVSAGIENSLPQGNNWIQHSGGLVRVTISRLGIHFKLYSP